MAKQVNRDGYDERSYKLMMNAPITSLSRYIGAKWFSPLQKLSEQSGVPITSVKKAVKGEKITPFYEDKLRKYLQKL